MARLPQAGARPAIFLPATVCLSAPLFSSAALLVLTRQVLSSGPELGRSLTQQELEDLSEEQKLQVLKIAEETVKAGSPPKGDS